MENGHETSVDTVAGVNLQPEEEVIGLLVRPNDLHNDARKRNLTDYHAVPDAVEQVEASLIVYVSLLLLLAELEWGE